MLSISLWHSSTANKILDVRKEKETKLDKLLNYFLVRHHSGKREHTYCKKNYVKQHTRVDKHI